MWARSQAARWRWAARPSLQAVDALKESAAWRRPRRREDRRGRAGDQASARFESDLVFSSGAYAAVVEIERSTGRLRVLRLAAVDDAGTIVNPLLAEGQVIGGTAQGLGECLVEEAAYDEEGNPTFASFVGYSLLTAAEMPPVETAFVESPSPLNPLGAKGIGEGGAIGTPAAVANAVADALGGGGRPAVHGGEALARAAGGELVKPAPFDYRAPLRSTRRCRCSGSSARCSPAARASCRC